MFFYINLLQPSNGHVISWKLLSLKVEYCLRHISQKECLQGPNSLILVKRYDSSQIRQVYLFKMTSGTIKRTIVDMIDFFFDLSEFELLFLELLIESTYSFDSLIFEFLFLLSYFWLTRSDRKEIPDISMFFLLDLSERLILV